MVDAPVGNIGIDIKVSGQVKLARYVYASPERLAVIEVEVIVYDRMQHQTRQTSEFNVLGLICIILPDVFHV